MSESKKNEAGKTTFSSLFLLLPGFTCAATSSGAWSCLFFHPQQITRTHSPQATNVCIPKTHVWPPRIPGTSQLVQGVTANPGGMVAAAVTSAQRTSPSVAMVNSAAAGISSASQLPSAPGNYSAYHSSTPTTSTGLAVSSPSLPSSSSLPHSAASTSSTSTPSTQASTAQSGYPMNSQQSSQAGVLSMMTGSMNGVNTTAMSSGGPNGIVPTGNPHTGANSYNLASLMHTMGKKGGSTHSATISPNAIKAFQLKQAKVWPFFVFLP